MINAKSCKVDCALELPDDIAPEQQNKWESQRAGATFTVTNAAGIKSDSINGAGSQFLQEGRIGTNQNFAARPDKGAGPPTKASITLILETRPLIVLFRLESLPLP